MCFAFTVIITECCVGVYVCSCPLSDTVPPPLQLPKPPTSPRSPRQRKRQHMWLGFLAVTAASPSSHFGWSTRRWRRQERTGWRRWKTSPHRGSLWRSRAWRKVGHLHARFKQCCYYSHHFILTWRSWGRRRMLYHIITMMMSCIITFPRPVNSSA